MASADTPTATVVVGFDIFGLYKAIPNIFRLFSFVWDSNAGKLPIDTSELKCENYYLCEILTEFIIRTPNQVCVLIPIKEAQILDVQFLIAATFAICANNSKINEKPQEIQHDYR